MQRNVFVVMATSLALAGCGASFLTQGDRDRDGVYNRVDQCPDDPEDLDGFEDADGCPEPDNDHDGILDPEDGCPNEPEDRDGLQDEDGCPDGDASG